MAQSDAELHAYGHARTALRDSVNVLQSAVGPTDNGRTRNAIRDSVKVPPSEADGRTRTAVPDSVNYAGTSAGGPSANGRARESTGYASELAQLMANCPVIQVNDDDGPTPAYLLAENYEEEVDTPPPMFLGLAPPHFQEAPPGVMQGTDIHNWEGAVQRLLRWLIAAGSRFCGPRC